MQRSDHKKQGFYHFWKSEKIGRHFSKIGRHFSSQGKVREFGNILKNQGKVRVFCQEQNVETMKKWFLCIPLTLTFPSSDAGWSGQHLGVGISIRWTDGL